MKKLMLCAIPLMLAGCATPDQQSSVPMDMKSVQEYQQRVASGKTVTAENPAVREELNQSDKRPKVQVIRRAYPAVYPTFGVGYGWGRGRYHSGVGLGYPYY